MGEGDRWEEGRRVCGVGREIIVIVNTRGMRRCDFSCISAPSKQSMTSRARDASFLLKAQPKFRGTAQSSKLYCDVAPRQGSNGRRVPSTIIPSHTSLTPSRRLKALGLVSVVKGCFTRRINTSIPTPQVCTVLTL